MFQWKIAIAGGFFLTTAALPFASADSERRHQCKVEVDVDELDADLFPDGDSWTLKVRYEVDVEDACRNEQFDLRLRFEDDDRCVIDEEGRAFGEAVRLSHPNSCDSDEQTFAGSLEIRLPPGAVCHPRDFEVHASVTRVGDPCVLDSEDTTATPHYPVIVISSPVRVVEAAPRLVQQPIVVESPRILVERPVVLAPAPLVVHASPRRIEVVRYHPQAYVEYRRRPRYVHVGVRW